MADYCYSNATLTHVVSELLNTLNMGSQYENFKNIQIYVLVTILVLLLQLVYLIKPFAYSFFRLVSWVSYLLVPALISYVFGLMGRQGHMVVTQEASKQLGAFAFIFISSTVEELRYLTCVWSTFLLFAYAGFDNLNAFSIDERCGRSKLLVQIGIQFSLLFLVIYKIPPGFKVVPLLFAFIILAIKFASRLVALAHSAGATPRIKNDVTRIIDYMNNQEDVGDDPTPELCYLVGPNYTKIKGGRIVEGIKMEKIWGSQGVLLGSPSEHNMELKNTCLSFALFWLLLGKIWSYPLYADNIESSSSSSSFRSKAWRLVRHGLLAEKDNHERLFRVIEIELAFLHDYFHARYIFFYLNGFYWKVISIIALPLMFWWFITKAVDYEELYDRAAVYGVGNFGYTGPINKIIIAVVVALEVIQVAVFLFSRWLKVIFLCFYVKKMQSKNIGCISRFFLEFLRSVFLGSSCSSNSSWKRELDQYSLVQPRTPLSKPTSYLTLQIISIVGLPFSKPGWKKGKRVEVSREVKEAVVLCLQQNDVCPKLTNEAQSLMRNEVIQMLPYWACNLKNDAEMIIVWHIATSACELHHVSPKPSNDMKVATELSKYCAYLLFFAPSLLPVPALAAEKICDDVIKETLTLFKKPSFGCGKVENAVKYEELMDVISVVDEEAEDKEKGKSMLKKGAELGRDLVTQMDEEKRWKVLAEFWAEMILYLAPSNNNELAHAGKLFQGGEFITHLWALLIHAGIYDRDDMA